MCSRRAGLRPGPCDSPYARKAASSRELAGTNSAGLDGRPCTSLMPQVSNFLTRKMAQALEKSEPPGRLEMKIFVGEGIVKHLFGGGCFEDACTWSGSGHRSWCGRWRRRRGKKGNESW